MYIKHFLVRHARPGVKLRNRVPIVSRNALANDALAAVHAVRGKQVSLCYIVLIDVPHFAVAAIVWTRRVDDQEKPDFLTGLRDSRSRSENFT